jgi:phage/plasmid-associated DNA primase
MLGRAIAGDVMKRFIFCVGAGNTGKSTLTQALEMACGGFFGTFNAGCLAYKETSNDEAQQLRWLMLLQTKRIIVSNEIKINHKLDANSVKKMSSGGKDKIVARLHGGNESESPFTALAIANMNDACEIAPKDDALNNRVKSFTYNKVYVAEVTDESSQLLGDPNVDTEVLTPDFRVIFINLLIGD